MKLTLRPEWRLWPLASFLGVLDLKTGVIIALLFALLNKVAGIYGLLALLFGAGGSFAQLSLYIYSTAALVALVWGLKAVKNEDPKHSLYFAHLFFFDHILSTSWTLFFATVWWLYTPHDGRRTFNSPAQAELVRVSPGATLNNLTDAERASAAYAIWNKEKGTAMVIIILSWVCKIYFALVVYSYAVHLRKGTYRGLPLSSKAGYQGVPLSAAAPNHYLEHSALAAAEEDELDDEFYNHDGAFTPRSPAYHKPQKSAASFTDFVSAEKHRHGGRESLDDDIVFDAESSSSCASSSSRQVGHDRESSGASTSGAP